MFINSINQNLFIILYKTYYTMTKKVDMFVWKPAQKATQFQPLQIYTIK